MTQRHDPHADWAREDMAREQSLAEFIAVHAWEKTYGETHPESGRLLDVLARGK